MAGEWKKVRLGDSCMKIGSGATPRGGKENYKSSGISLVRSQNVYNDHFDWNGLAFIDDEQASALSNVEVQSQDVLLNITGDSVARSCQVPDAVLPARVNQHVAILRPSPSILHHRYLRFFLIEPSTQSHLLSLAGIGATRNALTKGMIEDIEIPLPSLPEQKAIAHILGTLDDKIELNRKMNETLEAMARAIFKSWFVDFDPVHAKAKGKKPDGMDSETAALFPDSFVDSELGKIPKGWKVGSVYSCATYINGSAFRDSDFCKADEGLPIVKIAEIKNGISGQTKCTRQQLADKYRINNREILFSWSGSPDTSIDTFVWMGGEGWLNQHIFRVIPRSEEERCFLYFLLKCLRPVFIEIARDKQTTGLGHVTVKDMQRLNVVIPDDKAVLIFDEAVKAIYLRILANIEVSNATAMTRDALLPKLLSGEIRIKDAEKFINAAA